MNKLKPGDLSQLKTALDNLKDGPPSAGAWGALEPLSRIAGNGTDLYIDLAATSTVGAPVIMARPKSATTLPIDRLTPRQRQVAELIARGRSNKQIARELGLQLSTVKDHVHAVLRRLDLSSRAHLIADWPRTD